MANDPLAAAMTDPAVGPANVLRADTVRRLAALLGTTALVGGGARMVGGAMGAFAEKPKPHSRRQIVVSVPYPVGRAGTPMKAAAAMAHKLAVDAGNPWHVQLANALGAIKMPDGKNWSGLKETMFPSTATSAADMPGAVYGAGLVAPAGLYGGYKLVDHILAGRRKSDQKEELEAAKKRYAQALAADYTKGAGFDGLDELADGVVKLAAGEPSFPRRPETQEEMARLLKDYTAIDQMRGRDQQNNFIQPDEFYANRKNVIWQMMQNLREQEAAEHQAAEGVSRVTNAFGKVRDLPAQLGDQAQNLTNKATDLQSRLSGGQLPRWLDSVGAASRFNSNLPGANPADASSYYPAVARAGWPISPAKQKGIEDAITSKFHVAVPPPPVGGDNPPPADPAPPTPPPPLSPSPLPYAVGGVLGGGALGAAIDKKDRVRGALIGGGLGLGVGALANHYMNGVPGKAANLQSQLVGGYMLAGTAAFGLPAIAAYNYTKRHSRAKSIRDAIRRRAEQLQADSPAPIIAIPRPIKAADGIAAAAQSTVDRFKQQDAAAVQRILGAGQDQKPKPAPAVKPAPPAAPSAARNLGFVGTPA